MPLRAKRGRPLKFGRPAQALALRLPDDVVASLREADHDVARAIVALVQKAADSSLARGPRPAVSVTKTGRGRGLIIVDPTIVPALPGCHLMHITAHQAFIALEPGAGLADLEVAVLDRLAEPGLAGRQRIALHTLRRAVKRWRKNRRVRVYTRSIIVLEGAP